MEKIEYSNCDKETWFENTIPCRKEYLGGGKRSMTVLYKYLSQEVGSEVIIYKRGKVSQRLRLLNSTR